MLNSHGFLMLSMFLCPSILTSALWSVAMINHCTPLQTCNTSQGHRQLLWPHLQTGAFLDSAGAVKREAANIRHHPSLQQYGAFSIEHLQCFCSNVKPSPSLDQSVQRQVGQLSSCVDTIENHS